MTHAFSPLSSNTLLQTMYKQTQLEAVREEVEAESSPVPEVVLDRGCLDLVLDYTEQLYTGQGLQGWDSPKQFVSLAMRLLPRPLVTLHEDMLTQVRYLNIIKFSSRERLLSSSQSVRNELADGEASLVNSSVPDAAVLLYRYTTDQDTRDLTSAGLVGSAFIFQSIMADNVGAILIKAR